MINCNPETVSTDYYTSDRLYFEPLTDEDVISVIEREAENGDLRGVIVQLGGQTPLKIAAALEAKGIPHPWHQPGCNRPCRRPRTFSKTIAKAGSVAARKWHRSFG